MLQFVKMPDLLLTTAAVCVQQIWLELPVIKSRQTQVNEDRHTY